MAYKALYRKYRPNNFDSVVGQKSIIMTLQNIIKENKISHAYLFNGPRGTGKTSVAKIFAKSINCLNPINGAACDNCDICKQIEDNRVNDIIEIDAASNNGVDEIRELKSKISLAPTICKYKVYIIDEVHMLSMGAFNALLKTLEEPPRHVVFILATTEMQKLPLTIISRCQNYNFKKVTENYIKSRLLYIAEKENIVIEDSALSLIARVSDGGMRDAIGLLEQLGSYASNKITTGDVELISSLISREDIVKLLEDVGKDNIEGIFTSLDLMYASGKDFVKVAEDIVVFLKDILLYKKAPKYFASNYSYDMKTYNNLEESLTESKTYEYIKHFNEAITSLKISSHPKIIFEITILKLVNTDCQQNEIDFAKKNNSINKVDNLVVSASIDVIKKNKTIEPDNNKEESENETSPTLISKNLNNEQEDSLMPSVKIPLYKKILINNTLAGAEKELLSTLKTKFNQLETFLINKDFKQSASIMLDGAIVGVSKDNLIYAYKYESIAEKADNLINEVETLVSHITGKKLNVINISDDSWKLIRPDYVKLMKEKVKIEIIPEIGTTSTIKTEKKKKRSKEIEDAINIFGEELIEIK